MKICRLSSMTFARTCAVAVIRSFRAIVHGKEVIALTKGRKSALPAETCPYDGRPCNVPRAKWVMGAPACAGVVFFGVLASNGLEEQVTRPCPRFDAAGGVARFVDVNTGRIVSREEALADERKRDR